MTIIAEVSVGFEAASLVEKFRRLKLNFKNWLDVLKEIDCWKDTLEDIMMYTKVAETKQSKNKLVVEWLKDLDYMRLDIEDVITDLQHESMRREASSNIFTKFCKGHSVKAFRFGNKMIKRFQTINDRLKKNLEDALKYGLMPLQPPEQGSASKASDRRNSGALNMEPILFGREEEKRSIIDELLSYNDGDPKIGVLPIVGMCGIGKTTIAQDVFNDARVQNFFQVKAWFNVAFDYNLLIIKEGLLSSININRPRMSDTEIHNQLMEELKGKKFLIVLDHLWKENVSDCEELMMVLRSSSAGSKVIVTTRSENVADIWKTVDKYPKLHPLEFEACWKLFCSKVGMSPNGELDSWKEEVGKGIVRNSHGLPMAVAIFGGLLRNEESLEYWEDVRDHIPIKKEVDVKSVLMLSYNDLPSRLKKCFALLSLLPANREFLTYDVARLWWAEELINEWDPTGTERYHDVVEEFVARSLLTSSNYYWKYLIHDMVRTLACEVAGIYCCVVDDDSITRIGEIFKIVQTRHLHFRGSVASYVKFVEYIGEDSTVLRSLSLCTKSAEVSLIENEVCKKNYFSNLKYLRVLDCDGMSQLPFTHLKDLTKLRQLKIVNSQVSQLPDLSLYLECLILRSCENLVSLPPNIGKLNKLRSLELSYSGISKLSRDITLLKNLENLDLFECTKLKNLPSNIEDLKKLKSLDISGTKIANLKNLSNLCNLRSLSLMNCPIVTLPTKLQTIQHLKIYITNDQREQFSRQCPLLNYVERKIINSRYV